MATTQKKPKSNVLAAINVPAKKTKSTNVRRLSTKAKPIRHVDSDKPVADETITLTTIRRLAPTDAPILRLNTAKDVVAGIKLETQEIRGDVLRLTGWCLGSSKLALICDGNKVAAKLRRVPRQDVLDAYAATDVLDTGFELSVSKPEPGSYGLRWNYTDDAETAAVDFDLGIRIPSVVDLNSTAPAPLKTARKKSSARVVHANVEEMTNFTIRGWCVIEDQPAKTVLLRVGQSEYPMQAIARERKDVAAKFGIDEKRVGLEMQLPGCIWESVASDEDLEIQILADGLALTAPLVLSRQAAAMWVENLFGGAETPDEQFFGLLALEHIRFAKLMPLLPAIVQKAVASFADRMNLRDYLPAVAGAPAEILSTPFATLSHWGALRELNKRLGEAPAPQEVFKAVTDVMEEWGVRGEVRDSYLDSVIPTLCKYNVYARLRDVADIQRWHRYDHATDAWNLTLALPALMVSGHLDRATNLLWKLAKNIKSGWINTECIHFAVRELHRRERADEVDFKAAERFRYAVIGVLDAFRNEWFSRLHDLELVRAAVALLSPWATCTDYFRRDLVKSLIRTYGLVPDFWRLLQDHELPPHPEHTDLALARSRWIAMRQAIDSPGPLAQKLDSLVEPIRYFRRMGNPEANIVLREIVTNALPDLNAELTPGGRELIAMLLEDPTEGVRLAAFPLAEANRLQDEFPEMKEQLRQTIQALSSRPSSMFFEAQRAAATLVQATVEPTALSNPENMRRAVDALQAHVVTLSDWQNGFLGADLLAYCCECRLNNNLPLEVTLLVLEKLTNKAIEETKADYFLPPPVQAALTRLSQRRESRLLRAFLADIKATIKAKFGDRHDDIFQIPDAVQYPLPDSGYPRDTLIVIYSCRKYLDTRIAAIRATWAQDLKARGIPYLFLVGDGDDTIDGDVLALAVSDRYEHLPQKTLKLFNWVLQRTQFQYVLKIDDDCYLDVDQFVDSLTYRKHFYYGRVIERGVGGMDRLWHQSKSHTELGRKTIDKSPEPSTYADGGGGYALSRLAMAKLQNAAQSETGQRLIACSLMEDKMVGDLLRTAGIEPSNEDYESYQRRRTFADALPVGMWENTFYPTKQTRTVMTHLDTDRDHTYVQGLRSLGGLWPKKVWPTQGMPLIDRKYLAEEVAGTNQLELLSTRPLLSTLCREPVVLVGVLRNEMLLLPHFLDHYRGLGVRAFFLVDNVSDDGTREYLLKQPDVALFSADTDYRDSHFGVAWQQAILGNFCMSKWVLVADADEFLVYPECEHTSIQEYVGKLEADGIDAVRVNMIDMYPFGDLDEADFARQPPFEAAPWMDRKPLVPWRLGSGYYSNSASFTSALRHRMSGEAEPHSFVSQKYALLRYRPWNRLSEGLHYAQGLTKIATQPAWFAHFKYHSGFKSKAEAEVLRNQHFDNSKEYRRYLGILAEGRGCFGTKQLSTQFESSESFMALESYE
jgi:hypothetical protein